MLKRVVCGITLTLLLVTMLTLAFNIQLVKADPTTIVVPDDYPTIQEAINNANEGDRIFVLSGIYYENVVVNKTVSLVGENRETTIIDGNRTGTVVDITADNMTISGFTVQNSYTWHGCGIYLYCCFFNNVSNSIIQSNYFGIKEVGSGNNFFDGNIVRNNKFGIFIASPRSTETYTNNNISQNDINFGIHAFHMDMLVHNIDTTNFVDGKPIYYWVNEHNKRVPQDAGYIALINCTNILVENQTLEKNYRPMFLVHTNSSIVRELNLSDNRISISLYNAFNNTVSACLLTSNSSLSRHFTGIELLDSGNNLISSNSIMGYHSFGVHLHEYAKHNLVEKNIIQGNDWAIFLTFHSQNNSIMKNNLIENHVGISFDHSSLNLVYHNNFINNTDRSIYLFESENNTWDNGYPSGGNYWSDYYGTDEYNGPNQDILGSGGIGDAPYVIDSDNQDNYPLMGPFTDFPIPLEEEIYHVTAICNSTIGNFDYIPKTVSLSVNGSEGTVGFCRIMIPRVLLGQKPYQVLVDGIPISYNVLPCSNSTHVFLYIAYSHSSHKIVIKGAPPVPVGGVWVPINKSALLDPYIGLASLIAVAVASIVYVKHRKKKQQN